MIRQPSIPASLRMAFAFLAKPGIVERAALGHAPPAIHDRAAAHGFRQASGLLLHSADRRRRHAEIVRQQIVRARPYPCVEVDLLELALVPGLNDLEIVVPGVLDGVAEARRDVDGIARAYIRDLAAS